MVPLKIGWAGLGNMGMPMAKNIIKAGFEVSAFNRTKSKTLELTEAGAIAVDSPKQLTKKLRCYYYYAL